MTTIVLKIEFLNWLFHRQDTLVVDTGVDKRLFHPHFIAVPDGDLFALTRELVRTIGAMARQTPRMRQTIANGLATADMWTLQREEQSLLSIWENLTASFPA